MRFPTSRHGSLAVAFLAAGALSLSACSGLGGSDDSSSGNEITFLTNNDPNNIVIAEAVIKAFEEANPDIKVKLETRPGGGDGDNLVKTRLSTGDMADVFEYNSGSLFQAIAPTTNLTPVTDEPWVADLDDTFKQVVSAGDDVYGSPWQTIVGGGIFYNIPLYEKLGLEVPKTWDEFMANNEKIKAEGVAPVEQTFGDTWTSQMFVLADYHNVEAANPGWAEQYTNNEAKFATTPEAEEGFQHLQDVQDDGLLNEDYALGQVHRGPRGDRHRQGRALPDAHVRHPRHRDRGLPGQGRRCGLLRPAGRGRRLERRHHLDALGPVHPEDRRGREARVGQEVPGVRRLARGLRGAGQRRSGGWPVRGHDLRAARRRRHRRRAPVNAYVDAGNVTPALEFLSPIKGPALEQITVEVGSGIRPADDAAALYDQDVEKQAQQLGLEGW